MSMKSSCVDADLSRKDFCFFSRDFVWRGAASDGSVTSEEGVVVGTARLPEDWTFMGDATAAGLVWLGDNDAVCLVGDFDACLT
jgi:hypothetical protein